MHASINTGSVGHLSRTGFGSLGMTMAQCKASMDPGCSPDSSWSDLIFGSSPHGYYSTFCRNQRDVYEGCIKGEYPGIPAPPPAAGHAEPIKPGESQADYAARATATQADRDAQALIDWDAFVRGYQPDPPPDDNNSLFPWYVWAGIGAAVLIAAKRV